MPKALFRKDGPTALRLIDNGAADSFAKIKPGAVVLVEWKRVRSPKHMRLFFGVIRLVHENLPERLGNVFPTEKGFLDALKIEMGHSEIVVDLDGQVIGRKPKSIAFHNMGQDEFNRFFDEAMTLITAKFLPDVGREELIAEVEAMIADGRYDQQHEAA